MCGRTFERGGGIRGLSGSGSCAEGGMLRVELVSDSVSTEFRSIYSPLTHSLDV